MINLIRISVLFWGGICWGTSLSVPIVDINNKASLQRGAALFMNYCAGCHSLSYVHYDQMANDLEIPLTLVKDNLIFTQSKITDPIRSTLGAENANRWFGLMPPDLSLIARQKSSTWLYQYFTGFYTDETRPFGVNNKALHNALMPDVFELIKNQDSSHNSASQLKEVDNEFEQRIADLINFLVYVGEPAQLERTRLGPYVLFYFIIFLIPIYLLKRSYWKKIRINKLK